MMPGEMAAVARVGQRSLGSLRGWLVVALAWATLSSCGGASVVPVDRSDDGPVIERSLELEYPEVLVRTGDQALVRVGPLRARIGPHGARLADDVMLSGIEAAARLGDGSWVFRDRADTLGWSPTFLGRLRHAEEVPDDPAREGGLHLSFRGAEGTRWVSSGGAAQRFSVPRGTRWFEAASRSAALALVEGGFLHLTDDGGAHWRRLPHQAGAPFVHGHERVMVELDGRVYTLSPAGELEPFEQPVERIPRALSPRETGALVEALVRAGHLAPQPAREEGKVFVSFAHSSHLLAPDPLRYLGPCDDDSACAPNVDPESTRITADGGRVVFGPRQVEVPEGWTAIQALRLGPDRAAMVLRPREDSSDSPGEPWWCTASSPPPVPSVRRAMTVDLERGETRPLCALPSGQQITHVFARGDGGWFVRIEDAAGQVFIGQNSCASVQALPPQGAAACFVDAQRGVAWGRDDLSALWHTADGGASWQPTRVQIDGAPEELGSPLPGEIRSAPERCHLGGYLARWDGQPVRHVLGPLPGRPSEPFSSPPCPGPPPPALLRCQLSAPRLHPSTFPRRWPPRPPVTCTADTCSVTVELGAAPPIRLELPAQCSDPDGPPDISLHVREPGGLLLGCARGLGCFCSAHTYWVPFRGEPIPLDVGPFEHIDRFLRLEDGGFALFFDDVVAHVGPDGRPLARRAFHWREPWPRGLVLHEGRPVLAVSTFDLRAIELVDPADPAADPVRIRSAVTLPRRLCDPNDEGVLLGIEYDAVGLTFEDERDIALSGLTRFHLRALGESTCLAGVRLDTDIGIAELTLHGTELVGTLQDYESSTDIRCTFHLQGSAP